MNTTKWPGRMLNPMNLWVDRFFSEEDPFFKEIQTNWAKQPAVNVKETDKAYLIEVAAPGLQKEDFQISCENRTLMIRAEHQMENEKKEDDYMRREFNYTRFERHFQLPEDVQSESVKAHYDNGILQINMPRKTMKINKETRMIEVG
ncbi:MAG: Hsp20/alpha crystallin family protein [Saprospiraceae bacterium]|nr:Hsp20/alpha crystallin family protein [Saprospiraceae bacterium]